MTTSVDFEAARQHIEIFKSVGIAAFHLTELDSAGRKTVYEFGHHSYILELLPAWLASAAERDRSLHIRPGPGARFVQLDDLDSDKLEATQDLPFLFTLQTSPGNHQRFVGIKGIKDDDFQSVRRRLIRAAGSDRGATGFCHLAGDLNRKEKYRAAGFPRVAIFDSFPGRLATKEALEAWLAARGHGPETDTAGRGPSFRVPAFPDEEESPARLWEKPIPWNFPSYQKALAGAPRKRDGTSDRSEADWYWAMLSLQWGWSARETTDKLMKLSTKAKEMGRAYAVRTVNNARQQLKQGSDAS